MQLTEEYVALLAYGNEHKKEWAAKLEEKEFTLWITSHLPYDSPEYCAQYYCQDIVTMVMRAIYR